ncbi:MAG: hypothetical protein WBR15_09825 [Gammaproteobacteria bacterium]
MKAKILIALGTTFLVAACASAPPKPYWENNLWIFELSAVVQSSIPYPYREKASDGFPSYIATVQFTYQSGQLKDIEIIQSTGSNKIDQYIINRLATVKTPPKTFGPGALLAHRFQLPIKLMPPTKMIFYNSIYTSINQQIHYPEDARKNKSEGWILIKFQYQDGHILDSEILRSTAPKTLNSELLKEFDAIKLPASPPSLNNANKILNFQVSFCFILTRTAYLDTFRAERCIFAPPR